MVHTLCCSHMAIMLLFLTIIPYPKILEKMSWSSFYLTLSPLASLAFYLADPHYSSFYCLLMNYWRRKQHTRHLMSFIWIWGRHLTPFVMISHCTNWEVLASLEFYWSELQLICLTGLSMFNSFSDTLPVLPGVLKEVS